MAGPLAGATILDLSEWIAGPYATKLLADFGADVIKLERPEGDPSRGVGPYKDGEPHRERSGTFFYFNTNKRGITLDLKDPAGREAFGRLVDRADIVVESFRPGTLDRLGVGWQFIHARKPEIALVSVTSFGLESPYKDFRSSELVLYGFAGEMYTIGVQEREPVKMFGTAAHVEGGAAAATAILAALTVTELQGIGQHVDFALADAQFNGVDRRHAATIGWEFAKRRSVRAPGPAAGILAGVYPCADGYVEFSGAAARIDRLRVMLGDPEWLRDPQWQEPGLALRVDLVEEFNAHFLGWVLERTKLEIWEAARDAKVLCGPLLSVDELFADHHFQDRGFWAETQHPEMGAFTIPGRPFLMPASPWELRRPAPLLGQHTEEVLAECGYSADEVRALQGAGVAGGAK